MVAAAATPVDQLAICGLEGIELTVVGKKCQVTVYGSQADSFTSRAQFCVDILRTPEVL